MARRTEQAGSSLAVEIGKSQWQTHHGERPSELRLRLRRFTQNRPALLSACFILLLTLIAVFARQIAPYDPSFVIITQVKRPPSAEHLLGTDAAGRDVLSRLIHGARVSLSVGLVATGLYTVLGVILGGVSGFYGGRVDTIIQRFTEIIMCFPTFQLILIVVGLIGASVFNVMLIIGVFGWTGISRLVRAEFLSIKERDFVLAARSIGVQNHRLIFRHLLPNALAPIVVAATLGIPGAILAEAGLSFLGVGVSPLTPSWGNMMQVATSLALLEQMVWLWLPPGIVIAVTVICFNFLGEGLRALIDPLAGFEA